MQKIEIQDFLNTIKEIFHGMDIRGAWPLNGAQTDSYFGEVEALDMYNHIEKLRKEKSPEEIAKLLPAPDIVRLFLQHSAIIGLKVADKLKLSHLGPEERTRYTLFLLELIQHKVQNDVLCRDGKNLLLNQQEIDKIFEAPDWIHPTYPEERKQVAFLTIVLNHLCYSLFYDEYMTGGFYLHGPYLAKKRFGENTILVIREYHNINPTELWPAFKNQYKKITMYCIYRHLDLKINFANHPISKDTVGDKLLTYKILVDGKHIHAFQVEDLIHYLEEKTNEQTKRVNLLSNLDKVRKAAEIAFYLFKPFRDKLNVPWKPPQEVEKTIQHFGEKFIDQFKIEEKLPLEHWEKLFDPREEIELIE